MGARAIFGLQVLLSLVGYALIARFYAAPRLAALPLPAALTPLLLLHAFRHVGMVFLVPAVVGTALPAAFAVRAAYGDLLAALLALSPSRRYEMHGLWRSPWSGSSISRERSISSTPSIKASATTSSSVPRTTYRPSSCRPCS
jgi:hypothetical protein